MLILSSFLPGIIIIISVYSSILSFYFCRLQTLCFQESLALVSGRPSDRKTLASNPYVRSEPNGRVLQIMETVKWKKTWNYDDMLYCFKMIISAKDETIFLLFICSTDFIVHEASRIGCHTTIFIILLMVMSFHLSQSMLVRIRVQRGHSTFLECC